VADRYWVGGTGTWDATAGTKWALTSGGASGQAVPTTADTVFFDAASGANTVTIGAGVATCSTLTMTGFTGTIAFGTNKITIAGTGTIFTGATTYSVTGTPVIDCTNSSSSALSLSPTAVTEANSISFNITASSGTFSLGSSQAVKSLNFTGYTGNMLAGARTIYGNLTLSTGMSIAASTSVTTFGATSGTQTITSNTKTLDFPITFSGTATYQLVGAMSVGTSSNRTVTLTTGTLDLNNNTFTIFGVFSSSNTTTRAISFGTSGKFVMTSSNISLWSVGTATSLTITGTNPLVEYSGNITTATSRNIVNASTGGAEATAISFNITAGTDTITNGAGTRFKNLSFTGFAGTIANDTKIVYGNLTIPSGVTVTAGTSTTTFRGSSGTQSITTNANTLDFPITFDGTATYQLVDALTSGATRTMTLTSGTLDLNNKTLTTGFFSSATANTRAILFGTTGNLTIVGNNATIFTTATATGFTYTGTPTVNVTYSGSVGTRTISCGTTAGGAETMALDFNVSAGSDIVAITTYFRTLNFTGFTGSVSSNTRTLYGSLTLSSGMTISSGTATLTFAGTSGTQTITSAALNLDFPITFSGTATYQLIDNLSVGTATIRNITLTGGTLDLNNKTLTNFGQLASSSTNTRSILFGTTGNYTNTCTSTATVVSMATATGFTYTGTPTVNLTGNAASGVTRSVSFGSTAGGTETNSLNYNISAGSDSVSLSGSFKNINFTGFTGTLPSATRTIYGNLTFVSGMIVNVGANSTTFAATSGTQTITSAAQTLDFPITINGVGGTVQLVDALTMGSTRTLTLTNGTFNSNAKSVTCGAFSGNNSNTKTFTITNSTFTVLSGTSTSGFLLNGVGTTYNVTGSNVVFTTSTAAQYWGGGGSTFPAITMSGTGQLIIGASGSTFTITTLSNTVQPCTVSIFSTNTQLNVTNFSLSGTAGNLVTFNSSVAGTAKTISKTTGTVNAYYLAIQDSNAAGGATWRAISSVNNGNNTGWFFDYTETVIEDSILADTPDTTASFLSDIAEPLTLADTPSVSAAFAGVITEDTTLADTQSITAAFASAITEAATLADAQSVVLTIVSDISEAITLDNNQTVIANFASVVFENFDAADSQSVVASFTAVITENTDLADVESVLASFVASLSEALTAEDSSIGIRIHNSDIIENTTLADIQDALRTHNALISENLVPADAITVIASFTSQIAENLVLLDEPFPRGWFKINDDQIAVWAGVNNTDANTWTNINDGQLVVWTKVDNSFP